MKSIYGLILSFLLIPTLWGIAILSRKYMHFKTQTTRKIIHIGMGFYWIIAMLFFDDVLIAIIPPMIYLLLNLFSYKYNFVKEIEDDDKDNYGTIFYPLSLVILVIFSYEIIKQPYIGGLGILNMAFGDGLAALIGMNVKSKEIFNNKTLAGSITMFIVSFLVTLVITLMFNPSLIMLKVMVVPLVATICELFSRRGFDNLTIPISSTVIYYLLTFLS
ncbi:TPA: hypothetical protein GXZ54_02795 [bacterium]|jgi:phytol kinase|nr:hypothetical protein [bacterium]